MARYGYHRKRQKREKGFFVAFRRTFFSERLVLTYFYLSVMVLGAILLKCSFSIKCGRSLSTLDAFFVATSAITITGLVPVSMDIFTPYGIFILLILIQVGGLGFITFTTLLLLIPGGRISIKNARIVRNFFLSSVEYNPRRIIKDVLLFTFLAEFIGALLIWLAFWWGGKKVSFYYALFHSISAFCNAGISISDQSVELWRGFPWTLIFLACLTIMGGIGFVSLSDILRRLSFRSRFRYHLTLHTKIVLISSIVLLGVGTLFIFWMDIRQAKNWQCWQEKLLGAFFHSAMVRTGGFFCDNISNMPVATQIFMLPLMFIGAGPGSMSGGIKVTTFFLILVIIFRDDFRYNSVRIGNHQISIDSFRRAMVFFIRALAILLFFLGCVLISEYKADHCHRFLSLIFETVSALSTVGLSMGVTPLLSAQGKFVIMLAMLAGRVGLFSLAIYVGDPGKEAGYQLPEQEVLLG